MLGQPPVVGWILGTRYCSRGSRRQYCREFGAADEVGNSAGIPEPSKDSNVGSLGGPVGPPSGTAPTKGGTFAGMEPTLSKCRPWRRCVPVSLADREGLWDRFFTPPSSPELVVDKVPEVPKPDRLLDGFVHAGSSSWPGLGIQSGWVGSVVGIPGGEAASGSLGLHAFHSGLPVGGWIG